ncbi:unnamed protein product [Notodromas monacha]|uniref:DOCKER domain-containing protein n=1 Tax=Notodromas monacha TaxID=399045 RepID=A0A7R9BSI4_9CRUS|nr:unnamed protein product [Notodromas monacha]CAG0919848.1 unnamed protein product [Notodromas monacha]
MSMAKNEIVLAVTKQIAAPLQKFFLQSSSFSGQLWINYFNLCVTFITQPELQVEQFSAVRRTKVLRSGDMRLAMGAHVMCMWAVLGNEDRLGIIPALVGPFLDMTLVAQPLLRKRTIPIFFQIMETELFSKGNFKQVESELIDKLDIFISDGKGDENYVQMFQEILSEKVGESLWVGYGEWNGCALGFIKSVTDLLERLLDYRRVNRGREKHTEKSKMCIVNLLGFYKDIKREELYLRYVYKLHRLHLEGKLYTEAAYALKLHADLLAWSPRMLHSDDLYSAQAEWKRKETLYLLMITYFDLGGCWEKCIPLCKELAVLYESRVFDFTKLSEIHTRLAQFYDSILTKLRLGAEYFRVGFYGSGCPIFLRNKEFVMKGSECERVGDFTSRLQLEFPEARLMVRNTPPDESARSADGQFIQVCCVRPVARDKRADKSVPEDLVDPAKISDKILSFYEYNDVSTFRYDRPIVAPGSETCDNEFKNRWIERTTLKTEHSLPGILTGFVVVHRKTEMITPIDYASETLATTNKELKSLMAAYEEDPKKNLNPLTMRLTGIIDAAVMGGLPKYQEAFLSGEQSEYSAESVSRLKAFIQDQLNATAVALSLHAKLVPAEMIPLQERLVKAFGELEKKMNFRSQADAGRLVKQKSMTERIGMKPVGARRARSEAGELGRKPSIVNTPLPPIPLAESISLLCTGQLRMSSKVDEEEEDKIYCKPSEWRDEDEGFDAAMEYAEPLANEQYYTGVEEFSNSHMRWSGRSTGSTGSFSIPKESTRFSHPEIRATRLQFDDSKQRSVSGNNVSNVYKFVSDPPKSSTSPGPPVPPRAKIPQAPDAPPLPPRAPTIYSKSPQGAPPPQDLPPPLPRRGVSQGSPSMSFCADDEAPPLPPKVQPLSTANLLNVSTSSVESGDISPLRPNYCVPPPMQKANGNANILE